MSAVPVPRFLRLAAPPGGLFRDRVRAQRVRLSPGKSTAPPRFPGRSDVRLPKEPPPSREENAPERGSRTSPFDSYLPTAPRGTPVAFPDGRTEGSPVAIFPCCPGFPSWQGSFPAYPAGVRPRPGCSFRPPARSSRKNRSPRFAPSVSLHRDASCRVRSPVRFSLSARQSSRATRAPGSLPPARRRSPAKDAAPTRQAGCRNACTQCDRSAPRDAAAPSVRGGRHGRNAPVPGNSAHTRGNRGNGSPPTRRRRR